MQGDLARFLDALDLFPDERRTLEAQCVENEILDFDTAKLISAEDWRYCGVKVGTRKKIIHAFASYGIEETAVKAALEGGTARLRRWFAFGRRDPNVECGFFWGDIPGCDDDDDDDDEADVIRGSLLQCVLFPADRSDRSDLIRLLVSHGADVNLFFPSMGWLLPPALHLCQFPGEVEALLDAGADIDIREIRDDEPGRTALHCHAIRGHSALVKVLVHRGANVLSADENGDNALDLARWSERPHNVETAAFLEHATAAALTAYSNAPRVDLVQLRELCERGRATPPPESILERLFDSTALPKEVFWHILSFWRSSQDKSLSLYRQCHCWHPLSGFNFKSKFRS